MKHSACPTLSVPQIIIVCPFNCTTPNKTFLKCIQLFIHKYLYLQSKCFLFKFKMRSFKNLSLFSMKCCIIHTRRYFWYFLTVSTREKKVTNGNKSRSGGSLQNQNIAISHLPTLNNQISYWFNRLCLFCLLLCTATCSSHSCKRKSQYQSMWSMLFSLKNPSVSQTRVSNTSWLFWVDTGSLRTFSSITILSKVGCEYLLFQNTILGSEEKITN